MYHVYKRIVIRRNIMEARTQGGGTNVAMEGPGAESGPWGGGHIWNLSYGVRPSMSLGPADADLLTEPTFSQGGVYTPTIQKEFD